MALYTNALSSIACESEINTNSNGCGTKYVAIEIKIPDLFSVEYRYHFPPQQSPNYQITALAFPFHCHWTIEEQIFALPKKLAVMNFHFNVPDLRLPFLPNLIYIYI